MNDEIRVRIAPSPTGPLHIGVVHTALFNWLFVRKRGGKFILRVEDTDKERSKDEFITDITDGLSWLGFDWDEGPERNEPYGPYRQSHRLKIYQKYADELLKNKKAYLCYCTQEELLKERALQSEKKQPPKYSGKCCHLKDAEIAKFKAEGRKPSVRFIVPPQKIKFKDLIKGKMEFDTSLFGDFVILKSDGVPTFMFAGAIDDFLMKISHVIRGEDHLSNTPRQILLGQALDFSVPEYGHLPLILNPDRTKLSKRKNPTSITKDFRNRGYLPEAMIHFIALMGWSPFAKATGDKSPKVEQETWTLKDLMMEFDLSDVGTSPSIYDEKKLDYLNGYYIRKLSIGELAKRAESFLSNVDFVEKKAPPGGALPRREKLLVALSLVQERIKNLAEIPEQITFFFERPKKFQDILVPKGSTMEKTKIALVQSIKFLSEEKDFGRDSLEHLLRAVALKNNLKAGEVLWPIRVALSGKVGSPGTFELLEAFGKDESLERIKIALDMIK